MPVIALQPEAAAALLAAAGVRRGDTVVVAGGDRLLQRAAAAAAGPDGRVVDPSAVAFAATRVARVLATALERRPDAAGLAAPLGPGGRLAVALREDDADGLVETLTGRGWSLRHRSLVPGGVAVLALVLPAGDRSRGA